jgi:NADH dehydrogenase [ubiquinone] 1 alpha subcomplex assembly factor 5
VAVERLPPTDYQASGIPLPDASVHLVLSSLALHWVNDLPALLREVRRVLRPDGVFLAACLGGETLAELRSSFVAAEMERRGGVSPHVSPMMGVPDAGNLLAAAGFGIPTADADGFVIEYPSPAALMEHLQGMGENGAALAARPGARRELLLAAMAAYSALYGGGAGAGDDAAVVPATFDVIHMIGWAPAPTQPSPLRRGSVPTGFAARAAAAPTKANATAIETTTVPPPPKVTAP